MEAIVAYETVFGYRGMLCGMYSNQAHGRIKGRQETAESVEDEHVSSKESNGQLAIDSLGSYDLRRRAKISLFTL